MRTNRLHILLASLCLIFSSQLFSAAQKVIYPTAIMGFSERGQQSAQAKQVSDALYAFLGNNPLLTLVDRAEMATLLDESALNLSGMVNTQQAIQVGQLVGAKIIITGSIIEFDGTLMLAAKIISTETSRVLSASVEGNSSDNRIKLIKALAKQIGDKMTSQANALVVNQEETQEDKFAELRKSMSAGNRPTVVIEISERHMGANLHDPAAETEMMLYFTEMGYIVLDNKSAAAEHADIKIKGEGISEFAMRKGDIVSVKARLEVKAIERKTGQILAIDREIAVEVDLTEHIAAKKALQNASAEIAHRILPKLSRLKIAH